MVQNKHRVITVAKDREKDLRRIGKDAQDLFRQNPTSAYIQVLRKRHSL